jgi:hypothetical protein
MMKLTLEPGDEGCPSFCGCSCPHYGCCSRHSEDCEFVEDEGNTFDEEYIDDYYLMSL